MRFQVPTSPISARGIDDAVNTENIPRNFFRPRQPQHSCVEFLADQIVVLKLAGRLVHAVALEQVLDNFRLADIGHGDNLDLVLFQREVIEVPPNLSQTHNADPDFPVTHLATSVFNKIKLLTLASFYTPPC